MEQIHRAFFMKQLTMVCVNDVVPGILIFF